MRTLIALFFICATVSTADAAGWASKANYGGGNTNRASAFSIPSLAKGYFVGGYNAGYKSEVWQYDTVIGTWTQMTNFPGGTTVQAAFSIGNRGYVGTGVDGGFVFHTDFYEFDPSMNTWTAKANFPGTPRGYAVGFAINGKGYIGTGQGHNGTTDVAFADFYEYDPVLNSWAAKAPFPGGPRCVAAGFSVGSKGYIGMGSDLNGGTMNLHNDFWEYDPVTNMWTARANFGGGTRGEAACFSMCRKGYVVGGYVTPHGNFQKDLWQYDPSNNTWTKLADTPGTPRAYAPGFAIGSMGYTGTGQDATTLYQDFFVYRTADENVTVDFAADDVNLCSGEMTSFTDKTVGGPILWQWDFQGATPSTCTDQNPANLLYSIPGTYNVKLIINNGCVIDSLTKVGYITVNGPLIDVGPDRSICMESSTELKVLVGDPSYAYEWTSDPAGFLSNDASPHVTPTNMSTTYAVTATDMAGCIATDELVVTLEDCENLVYIPNTFTPNGDDLNDVFLPFVHLPKNYSLKIYNRWGELVFVSTDPAQGWDGKPTGSSLSSQQEVYVYRLDFRRDMLGEEQENTYRGHVTLMR